MNLGDYTLELRHISKTFPGIIALNNVNFEVRSGEVHALLGENGAGKSTLIKILSGYHQPDKGGEMLLAGKPITFRNPKDAIEASIHTIYQELTLCPHMTVAENIVLDKQDQFKGFLQRRHEYQAIATQALEDLGQSEIDPNWLVKDLSIAQQQGPEVFLADATLYLEFFSIVTIAWQWLLQGVAVQKALNNSAKKTDQNFYRGKMFTLRYFFAYELPKTLGLARRLLDEDRLTVDMQTDFFND